MNLQHRTIALITVALLTACGGIEPVPDPVLPPQPGGSSSIAGTLIFPGQVGNQPTSVNQSAEFVPGEVILKFRSDITLQNLRGLSVQIAAQTVPLERVRSLGLERTSLFQADLGLFLTSSGATRPWP